jgi:hypothetical protein
MMSLHREITNWHKASASDRDFENCVEVGKSGDTVGVRDAKHFALAVEQRPVLAVSGATFAAFAQSVVAS